MNKHIERIRKQAASEAKKSGLVILGAVGGLLIAKGIRKFTEDKPTLDSVAKIAIPSLYTGGGFILTTVTEEKSNLKYLGYGLMVAGVIEGVKLIPVAKDYLSGLLGENEIPAANAFFTEDESRNALMNGFGLSSLKVGKTSMQDAERYNTNLPDLEGAEDDLQSSQDDLEGSEDNGDLGFNPSATDDADNMSGIL